ncbi:hypothetical protein AB0B54_35205 [Microbispora bryophytorum]
MQRFQLREEGAARRDASFFGHRLSRKGEEIHRLLKRLLMVMVASRRD